MILPQRDWAVGVIARVCPALAGQACVVHNWNTDVTIDDVIAARHDWERARARGLDRDRVAHLRADLEGMCRAHVWQLVEARRAVPRRPASDLN